MLGLLLRLLLRLLSVCFVVCCLVVVYLIGSFVFGYWWPVGLFGAFVIDDGYYNSVVCFIVYFVF